VAARRSLRRRMLFGLMAYVVLAAAAVFAFGVLVNRQAEQALWEALLESEYNHLLENRPSAPGYHRWVDTEMLTLYGAPGTPPIPDVMASLPDGLHDGIEVGGKPAVVLLRNTGAQRWALSLDASDVARRQSTVAATVLAAMLLLVVALGFAIGLGIDRLLAPLRQVARRIGALRPDRVGERISEDAKASSEVAVITDALNDYLRRNARFVERERAFVDSASHELRTPISVIAGAAELAAAQPGLPTAARQQIARIRRTSREVERLITLLLVLAKEPGRLASASDVIELHQLLPEIVEDHRGMADDKGLSLVLGPLPRCDVVAPMPVVQAALGNLLRNAIENSDRGEVSVRLGPGAVVEIEDPGHGMTPEEISAIHARMARDLGRQGGGIGLELIARLCEHLGWKLSFASAPGEGTTARLDLAPSD
jgi:signal transduction histidine kinase